MTTALPKTVFATAERLTAENPARALPCPGCSASPKGENFAKHWQKVHAGVVPAEVGVEIALVGIDRRSRRAFVVPLISTVAAMVVAVVLGVTPTDTTAFGGIALLLATLVLAALAHLDKFGARLVLAPDHVRAHYALGSGSTQVALPAQVELGGTRETKHSIVVNSNYDMAQSYDVDAGAFLRLTSGGKSVTVGCRKPGDVRKYWDPEGWSQSKAEKHWDVTLDAQDFVALQYHLAEHGMLAVRG